MGRKLYRAMYEDPSGKPRSGASAQELGVRVAGDPGIVKHDIEVEDGLVLPGPQGMSVQVDDPFGAPPYRLPIILGGLKKTTMFELDEDTLPELLKAVITDEAHAVLAPTRACSREELETALEATKPDWKKSNVKALLALR